MVGRQDKGSMKRDVFCTRYFQTIVYLEEKASHLDMERISGRCRGQLEMFRGLRQQRVPVYLFHLHACLAIHHQFCQGSDIGYSPHFIGIYLHSESSLDEVLQSHLIQRVKGEVGLKMISGTHGQAFLCLYVLLDNLILGIGGFHHLHLGGICFMLACLKNFLEFESLQFLHPGTRQIAMVHKQCHHLLVIGRLCIIRFQHLFLEQLFLFLLCLPKSPVLLRNDDGTQHITILYYGSLSHHVGVPLQFELYLIGLYVLSIAQHNDFFSSASDVYASLFIHPGQITGMNISVGIQHLSSLLRFLPVSLHHIGTLGTQFSIHQFAVY